MTHCDRSKQRDRTAGSRCYATWCVISTPCRADHHSIDECCYSARCAPLDESFDGCAGDDAVPASRFLWIEFDSHSRRDPSCHARGELHHHPLRQQFCRDLIAQCPAQGTDRGIVFSVFQMPVGPRAVDTLQIVHHRLSYIRSELAIQLQPFLED